MNHKLAIAGAAIYIVGSLMLGLAVNWWATGGVLLMIFGNNMERSARK